MIETEKKVKEVTKAKKLIEDELHLFKDQCERESSDNYKFTIDLTQKEVFGKLNKERHDHDIILLKDMLKKKEEELLNQTELTTDMNVTDKSGFSSNYLVV